MCLFLIDINLLKPSYLTAVITMKIVQRKKFCLRLKLFKIFHYFNYHLKINESSKVLQFSLIKY